MKTILLVEDDPAIQRGIRENLERERFRVLVERDGARGLDRARHESLDLVILDVMLPTMNGFDICARLKKEAYDVPIFMLTGLADEHSKLRGLGLGADDYLPKPFSVKELLLRIRNALDRTERTLGKAKAFEQELRKAREIQKASLPQKAPRVKGLDVYGRMVPATHVGGDYFDYLRFGPHRLGVIVADVCGKGMPAALHVQKMQGIVHASKAAVRSARDILLQLQEHLGSSMDPSSFVTAVAAVFDVQERTVDIATAGHPPVLLRRGTRVESLKTDGMWIGQMIGQSFSEVLKPLTVESRRGDTLVFYTDGVTESMNGTEEEFGSLRLQRVLARVPGDGRKFVDTCFREVKSFTGPEAQSDDITVVAVNIE